LNHTLDVSGILCAGGRVVSGASTLTQQLARQYFERPRTWLGKAREIALALRLAPSPGMLALLGRNGAASSDGGGNRALDALLASAGAGFTDRGFHNTRVDDLVAAAGVSHGAFYRYLKNKDELARILTVRAVQTVGEAVLEIPEVSTLEGTSGRSRLRRWLRRYHAAHANEAGMLRVG
jgi:hypothetical protein